MTPLWPDLSRRATEPEQMDRPDCDGERLARTLGQYRAINATLSASRRLIRRYLFPLLEREADREFTWLDIGAGACDLPMWVIRVARARGWRVRITALDHDPRVVEWARKATAGYPEISVVAGAVEALPSLGVFDIVFANHLLHHLDDAQVPVVVAAAGRQARLGFLLNDLRRSRFAYLGFYALAGLFLRSSLAFEDGLLSIRRGFTGADLERWMRESGTRGRVFRVVPGRVVITGTTTRGEGL